MGPRVDFLVRRLHEEDHSLAMQLATLRNDEWMSPVYAGRATGAGATETWRVRDILAHLVSAEGYLRLMIADVAGGGLGAPPGIDLDAINAREVAALAQVAPDELARRLRVSRAETIALVASFTDDDLDRRGNHPALGVISVEDFVKLIYRHIKMHLRDTQRALVTG